jgi:hypothetical protein
MIDDLLRNELRKTLKVQLNLSLMGARAADRLCAVLTGRLTVSLLFDRNSPVRLTSSLVPSISPNTLKS